MFGEDQERLEEYLELEHYIDDLQVGRVAHIPAHLTTEQAHIYRMAQLFHSASQPPEVFTPSSEFIESLFARLNVARDNREQDVSAKEEYSEQPALDSEQSDAVESADDVKQPQPASKKTQPVRFVPRRSLLRGSLVAAVSLLASAGVGAAAEHEKDLNERAGAVAVVATPSYPAAQQALVPMTIPTRLHLVTTVEQLGDNAVRFEAGAVTGYVVRSTDTWSTNGIIAMSASCTHMGCLVQWEATDRSFHCPCHGGLFDEYGSPDAHGAIKYLAPLPRLETVIQDGKIYVRVPDITI